MKIGVVGLGKMGANISLNLIDHGHEVIGFDSNEEAIELAQDLGVQTAANFAELVDHLQAPRVLWVMVPSGAPTESVLQLAMSTLEAGDILVDAGNSNYKESVRHAEEAKTRGIRFLDAGTSGGKSGARNGACLMVGGDSSAYEYLEAMFKDIAVKEGCMYTGRAGSGHFMKMVHNGIEYGMMQAIGEGLEVMRGGPFEYDLAKVVHNWNHGSVIRGWLMELMETQLIAHPDLSDIKGIVAASGEAKWTVEAALEHEIPVPVIALSLMVRNASQREDSYTCKVLSALRNGFGGHEMVVQGDE